MTILLSCKVLFPTAVEEGGNPKHTTLGFQGCAFLLTALARNMTKAESSASLLVRVA